MENSESGLAELLTGRCSSRRSAVDSLSRLPGCTHAVHLSSSSVSDVVMQHVEVKAKSLSRPRVGSPVRLPPLTANCTVEQRTSQNRTQTCSQPLHARILGCEALRPRHLHLPTRVCGRRKRVTLVRTGGEASQGLTDTSKQSKHSLDEPAC